MLDPSSTLDGILNQRVMLEQPMVGYRIAVDTVLLAAAVPALAGDKVLDLGCGVGGAMLCLACRVGGLVGMGLEIQKELVELCARNIERNAFAKGLEVRKGDATVSPSDLSNSFDHVFMNPPYHEEKRHDASPNDIKHVANIEKPGEMPLWLSFAASALKPSGTLTIIHRADRKGDILAHLEKAFGEIEVLPLLPRNGTPPKRVIIRARKDAPFLVKECQPFVLHKDTEGYTDEADAVLRDMQAVPFRAL